MYKKAEDKYLLIKKLERAMKEVAIDCPLNVYGNMFKEEIEKYKNYQAAQRVYRETDGKPTKKDRRALDEFLDDWE